MPPRPLKHLGLPTREQIVEFIQSSDVGSEFRIDPTSCQYVYNLGASGLGPGTYQVQINIGGSTVGTAEFSLR